MFFLILQGQAVPRTPQRTGRTFNPAVNQLLFLRVKATFLLSSSPLQSVPIWGFRMAAQRVCQRSAQTFGPAADQRGRRGRGQVQDTGQAQTRTLVSFLCLIRTRRRLFFPPALA